LNQDKVKENLAPTHKLSLLSWKLQQQVPKTQFESFKLQKKKSIILKKAQNLNKRIPLKKDF